jgi:L-rhamnose mutarotase
VGLPSLKREFDSLHPHIMKLVNEEVIRTYEIYLDEALSFPSISEAVETAFAPMQGWSLVAHTMDYDTWTIKFVVRKNKDV